MSVTIESLANEIREVLANAPIETSADRICAILSKGLLDHALVAEKLPDRAPGQHPREVLYEDPDLGFCICGHVYSGAAESGPHDHGSSWAIYGQADGTTEMTDWRIVDKGDADTPIQVVPTRTYTLQQGDAHFYGVGAVHSPKRVGSTRLIRIEGANLDHVQRSNIEKAT